jgi:alkaline phosphatase
MSILKTFLFLFTFIHLVYAQSEDKPKNIILLIGDGLGINSVGISILSLQNDPYRSFNSIGLSITSSADNLITDSGAGATALATGYRTYSRYISVDTVGNPLYTLFDHAKKIGKSTGIVVTSSVTHATPAAFISKVEDRSLETIIAEQLVQLDVDVVIGGGYKFFKTIEQGGIREDEYDLSSVIKQKGYNYVEEISEMFHLDKSNKFYALLGEGGLERASERNYSLGDLTKAALSNLEDNPEGFILMVEGSQIDWAGHSNDPEYLISEIKDFNEAINEALLFAKEDRNTLVVVTADHETGGMTIIGGEPGGKNLELRFSTKGHTAELVGVFAYGPGEELFRGIYENYMIGRKLFYLIDPQYVF